MSNHYCTQEQNIEWIKHSLIRIETVIGSKIDTIGLMGITTQNLATEIHTKVKTHRWQIKAIWATLGTVILSAITGVCIYLTNFHHVH